VYAEVGSHRQS